MNTEMKKNILEDGVIDVTEVAAIKADVFADGVIDQNEVRDLFELNNAVSGKDNDPSWEKLMVEAVTSYCLEDETSPGVVDQEEGDFLADMIEGDEQVDAIEVAILTAIKAQATAIESERLNNLIASI
jgi:hypothetical protein